MSGMGRREFVALVGGAAAWPLSASAQQPPERMRRIGIIDDAPMWNAFRQGLREHGYLEGQNIALDYKYADGVPERLAEAAAEFVRRPVDVIATYGTPPTPGSQGGDGDHPDCHDRNRRSGASWPRGKHCPARWKCHREHHPWPGGRRQAAATLQGGCSHHLTHGLSRESG